MPAVTQQVSNFLGGVSRQTDDKKLPNQLTECVNGYPDATFGLLKRAGMSHINVLKKADGTAFNKTELDGATWFFIDRATAGSYIGAIKGAEIYVWTAADGTWCQVYNNAPSYFSGATDENDWHFRSIQDTTIVTNKTVTTAMQAAPTYVANAVGTLKLLQIDQSQYTVVLQGDVINFTPQNSTTFDQMLTYDASHYAPNHEMVDAIRAHILARHTASDPDFTGAWYINSFTNSITLRRTTEANNVIINGYPSSSVTYQSFTLDASGGIVNDYLQHFQDSVGDISRLPLQSFDGHVVKINNTNAAEDDYYLQFNAFAVGSNDGYWGETRGKDTSIGFDAATMPHELVNTNPTTFTFGPITWKERLAGDTNSNPDPSFIGQKITSTFFYNNRFGMLAEDNVILGVANDAYNFFNRSATTQIDSDPIDLNVASIRPVRLFEVLPSAQGLLLFSERQQFQLFSSNASTLTPTNALIRSLSTYEMDTNVKPVDTGTIPVFLSKIPGYSKLFTMTLRDIEQTPVVVDISKAVERWIPDSINDITASTPNSLIILIDRGSSYLYCYRYYNNGKEDLFQSWTKWEVPGDVQAANMFNDSLYVVSQQEDEYTIGSITVDDLPTGEVESSATAFSGNPAIDMAVRPVAPDVATDAVVYDNINDVTKIYVPYTPIADKPGVMLLTLPTADVGTPAAIDSDQGYYAEAIERTDVGTGYRYFEVKGDFTAYADGILIGYGYEFEAVFPMFYFRPDTNVTDFAATLTINRVKVTAGKTGALRFKSKAKGSDEWKEVLHTADGDYYQGDKSPVLDEKTFTLPINQRNTNFELKVTSNFPYPVSLVSMMWEGFYSPRYYRRR